METFRTQLRCDSKLHAILEDEQLVEIACHSSFCGYERGVVVLHRFDIHTGELIETRRYKNPAIETREG